MATASSNIKNKEEDEAMDRLRTSFKLISKKNIHKLVVAGDPFCSNLDVTTMCLEAITLEVESLEKDVKQYPSPHFTRNYQILQGEFSKLLADLDVLKLKGRDDIRQARKLLLIRIEDMGDTLAEKTHSSGASCDMCEIKI